MSDHVEEPSAKRPKLPPVDPPVRGDVLVAIESHVKGLVTCCVCFEAFVATSELAPIHLLRLLCCGSTICSACKSNALRNDSCKCPVCMDFDLRTHAVCFESSIVRELSHNEDLYFLLTNSSHLRFECPRGCGERLCASHLVNDHVTHCGTHRCQVCSSSNEPFATPGHIFYQHLREEHVRDEMFCEATKLWTSFEEVACETEGALGSVGTDRWHRIHFGAVTLGIPITSLWGENDVSSCLHVRYVGATTSSSHCHVHSFIRDVVFCLVFEESSNSLALVNVQAIRTSCSQSP